ncbi:MAG: hypothetical protein ACYS0E_21940 [Planctomycetota bacterium]|jgi:hypothetical protein
MRTLLIVALVGIAFGAGYLTHSKLADSNPERAARDDTGAEGRREQVIATLTEAEREGILKRNYPDLVRMRETVRDDIDLPQPEEEAEESAGDDDQIEEWLRSASGQWKAYAGMQAKNKVRGLLAGLGFDADTAKQIEDAIVADVARSPPCSAFRPRFRRTSRRSSRHTSTTRRSAPSASASRARTPSR